MAGEPSVVENCTYILDGQTITTDVVDSVPFINQFDMLYGSGILLSLYCETNGVTYPANVDLVTIYNVAVKYNYMVTLTGNWVPETCTLDTQVLIDIANAIREKFDFTDMLSPSQFKDYIGNTISFTVYSHSYNAVEGMTWEDWVESPCNFDEFYISGNYVYAPGGYPVIGVQSTSAIISGNSYDVSSCCFMPGTQVMISLDGESRPIEEMKAGDSVVSYNVETGENYIARVNKLIINKYAIAMARVELANGTVLDMTDYHPLYTKDGWHSITNKDGYDTLVIGDVVKTMDGWSEIVKIERYNYTTPTTVYTLDVEDIVDESITEREYNDNFYANGVVAHNAGCV